MTLHFRLHRLSSRTIVALSIGILIALVGTGLAACGSRSSNQVNSSSTQAKTQAAQLPAQVQKCGIVQGLARLEVPVADNGAQRAENCFWQAYQHCLPATLDFITTSLDTALIRTFTIHNNQGTCSISDARQLRVMPNQLSAVKTFTCTGLVQQQGLRFLSCGEDGNVFVPGS
jgi:hypothetical protein